MFLSRIPNFEFGLTRSGPIKITAYLVLIGNQKQYNIIKCTEVRALKFI